MDKQSNDSFIVYKNQTYSYEYVMVYDRQSKTLATFTSKANVNRLRNRKLIKSAHYIDALLTLNKNYKGMDQLSFFDGIDDAPSIEDRTTACDKIIAAVKGNKIEKYVLCEYDIRHKLFSLASLRAVLYAQHFSKVDYIPLFDYMQSDYRHKDNSVVEAKETRDDVDNIEEKTLDIKIKKII